MKKHKLITCANTQNFSSIEVKKIQWASALNALMLHSGKTRSEMAETCNISKGRITRILSGDSNLTIETICSFAHSLGYDVDIAFYNSPTTKPFQPWNSGQYEFSTFRKLKKILSEERNLTTASLTSNANLRELAIDFNYTPTWLDTSEAENSKIIEFSFK